MTFQVITPGAPRTECIRTPDGQYRVTIDAVVFILTGTDFEEFARQVLNCTQFRVLELERTRIARVACGSLPLRSQFAIRFAARYGEFGRFQIRGHHAQPDGDHAEDELWAIVVNSVRAGNDGNADARELAHLILSALGFRIDA